MLPLSAEDPRMIGEFRLHARLGSGGMGRVFLASSPGGRAVAVTRAARASSGCGSARVAWAGSTSATPRAAGR
jgi:hypothetical protein